MLIAASPTPILDGEQPLPVRKIRWVLALLGGVAFGGVLIALDRARGSPEPLIPLPAFPLFVLALYISILAHELGHAIAAVTAGFELRALMVGAFLLRREGIGWRFRFVPGRLFAPGGLTSATPRSADDLLNRHLRFVLGGPAASFLLLVATLLLPKGLATGILLWVNLLLSISACIPYTSASMPSDAKLILLLARKGAVAERLIAILYLFILDGQGKRPRDWPPELMEKLGVSTEDKSRMPTALGLLLNEAADKENHAQSAEILERALAMSDRMPPDARRGFLAAASGYHGFFRRDASQAEEWLKRARSVKSVAAQKDWDSRAFAAVSYAKGDYVKSSEALSRYIALLDRQPMGGMILAERERTMALINNLTKTPVHSVTDPAQ